MKLTGNDAHKKKERKMITLNDFTANEITVLKAIWLGDHYCEMPSQCFENISDLTPSLTKDQIKGVIGSLFKKDALREGEYPNGMTAYHLVPEIEALLD